MLRRLVFFLGFLPLLALGQSSTPYFEFAPKVSDPIDIDDQSGEVFEVLLPQNDHISAIDIWYDNEGSAGDVSFGLRKEGTASLLAATTITVPTTPATFEGTRLLVDFGTTVSVSANTNYTIKVLSEAPDFRIYKVNRRIIQLEHTQAYTSEFVNGVMRIDSDDTDHGFKFALYENAETVAPVISNATTTIIDLDEVDLTFNANEPVDFRIQYTPTSGGFLDEIPFTGEYTLCSQGASPCLSRLTVVPDTTYNYTLTAKDEWGNEAEISGTFESLDTPDQGPTEDDPGDGTPATDTTPPIISNLRITFLDDNELQIAWTTNEVADSFLKVTTDSAGLLTPVVTSQDTTLELEHVLATSDVLSSDTTYYAHVTSTDQNSNIAAGSITFTTLASPPPADPPESDPPVDPPPADPPSDSSDSTDSSSSDSGSSDSGGGSLPLPELDFDNDEGSLSGKGALTFKWQVPGDGDPEDGYRLDIFDENNNLVKQIFVGPGEGTSVTVTDLLPGKYTIIIYSNRGGVFQKIAQPTVFDVLPQTFFERALELWYVYILILITLVGAPWYFIHKERARLAEVTQL